MGLYKNMFLRRQKQVGKVKTVEKAGISLFSGFIGSMVGNPSDLALIRFQSDGYLPKEQRRNYKHIFDALYRIIREEGFFTLWRGSAPTICRAMAMNLGMMTTYDEVKEFLNRHSENKNSKTTRLAASAISGLICSFMSLPFDNIKTKMQKMVRNSNGVYPYNGVFDCFMKSIKREGVIGLWVGYPTFYFRVAPHAMIALLILDFLHINFGNKNH